MTELYFCFHKNLQNKLSKFIITNENNSDKNQILKLMIDDDKTINFRIVYGVFNWGNIVMEFSDAIEYLGFLIKNNIHCRMKFHNGKTIGPDTDCKCSKNYEDYLLKSVTNGKKKHILFFFRKLLPYLRTHHDENISVKLGVSISLLYSKQISTNAIKYMFKISHLTDFCVLFCGLLKNRIISIKFVEYIMDSYQKKLVKHFVEDKIDEKNIDLLNFHYILKDIIYYQKSIKLLQCVIDEFSNVTNNIDINDVKKKYRKSYDLLSENYMYDKEIINSLITYCIYSESSSKFFNMLTLDMGDYKNFTPDLVDIIMTHSTMKYTRIFFENVLVNYPDEINKLFLNSVKYNNDVVDLLVEYGADYNKYGQ
ncbi:hypothetical protein [Niemeyer virus]|uniref:Uncharacterized protein n=1 Tax=Acanthamoeba polyphaga mimivirus Kroon TaxID=3069720 RepID=A0A0G2Y5P6_9VIRU|nr:hypothetical protein QJ850_gp795 [Acanthamoeba polyphaga mimivirus]AKI79904.1 hypothetical protein [Acanthamoeba polyphaga mimivirus Kroon]ALR83737.1 hypothetical protein [Niemeyer virus]